MTRVTTRSIQESTLARLQGSMSSMAKLQEQASSGKKINRPSDDPVGTVSSLQIRQQLRLNDQYARSASDGLGWLNTADTALQTTSSQLMRAQSLVVQALSTTTTQNPGAAAAIASELQGIRQTVVSLANTQYNGRNVFAGTTTGQALTASGTPPTYTWAAVGNNSTTVRVDRQVDATSKVPVDVVGADVFGTDAPANGVQPDTTDPSAFKLLDQIISAVRSGDTTSLGGLETQLQGRLAKVAEGLADVGARSNRITQAQNVAADTKVTLTSQLSDAEDADMPTTIVQLQLQQTAYQAALHAHSKVLSTSLMDFLT